MSFLNYHCLALFAIMFCQCRRTEFVVIDTFFSMCVCYKGITFTLVLGHFSPCYPILQLFDSSIVYGQSWISFNDRVENRTKISKDWSGHAPFERIS